MKRLVATLVLALLLAVHETTYAQDMERILLPIAIESTPGAHGSIWVSDVWVHANTDEGVTILPLRIADFLPIRRETIQLPILKAPIGHPPGQFLFVTRQLLSDVHVNLRVRDVSRQMETWGTEIPVVRDSDFREDAIALLPIPLSPDFRTMIRVYSANEGGGNVRVRVAMVNGPATLDHVLYEATLNLSATGSQYSPPYAEFTLPAGVLDSDQGVARVDIEPLTTSMRVWAFGSITHNETQHVTTVSPQ